MRKVIENVKFMQDGTMVFGDLYLENGCVERIDYKTPHMLSRIAIPGFVDLHTHGFRGYSCDECDPKRLVEMALEYAKRGTTTFCPTLSARSLDAYAIIIEAYAKVFQGNQSGARFGGFHLEGPYLHPDYAGTMDRSKFQKIDLVQLDAFLAKYHEYIRIMTIAPDVPLADEAIRYLHLYGVEISLGHTNASYAQTMEAFDMGANHITHLGNTMPHIDHHCENMMDAVLLSNCFCEIIMDGVHIQPKMLEWIIRLLGRKRVIAISDGTKYSGYTFMEPKTLSDGRVVRNYTIYQDDKAVGSCMDLLQVFQYLYERYDFADCIQMCSVNAAKLLKTYTHEIGLGKQVDLVVLDPELHIHDVIVYGKSVF